jgi:hypothetical protein
MPKLDLLPGVVADSCGPKVICDSRPVVRRARRLAFFRDLSQLLIVAAVDGLFVRWPLSHVPLIDRHDSLLLVAAFNALVAFHLIISRKLPQWSARRIASTWCAAERNRFATTMPQHGRR